MGILTVFTAKQRYSNGVPFQFCFFSFQQSKQRAQNALNLVSQVGDSLLSTKAVGEKPTVFKTKSLEVLLDRQRSSDMGGKKLGEGSSGVALPSGNSLFSNNEQSAPEAVDSQVWYTSVCFEIWSELLNELSHGNF